MARQKRCGYCSAVGHNKRTCESYKQRMESYGYAEEDYRPTRRKVTCSMCGREGHTKRTCPQLAYDADDNLLQVGDFVLIGTAVWLITRIGPAMSIKWGRYKSKEEENLKIWGIWLDDLDRVTPHIQKSYPEKLPNYMRFGRTLGCNMKTRGFRVHRVTAEDLDRKFERARRY